MERILPYKGNSTFYPNISGGSQSRNNRIIMIYGGRVMRKGKLRNSFQAKISTYMCITDRKDKP